MANKNIFLAKFISTLENNDRIFFVLLYSLIINTHDKMEGKVKWFDNKKGFGFLICEDGKEVFVHYSGIIKDGFKALSEGQRVSFEIEAVDRGEQAINVVAIEKE